MFQSRREFLIAQSRVQRKAAAKNNFRTVAEKNKLAIITGVVYSNVQFI